MKYIAWLDELSKESGNLAGGKGANLGEMVKLQLPVPPAFIVTTKAFDDFLDERKIREKIDSLIKACNVDDTKQLLETSEKVKEIILSQEIPPQIEKEIIEAYETLSFSEIGRKIEIVTAGRDFALVAVRSSATTEDLPTASYLSQRERKKGIA